jgi:L-lactate dehydrogenase complex protein LldG
MNAREEILQRIRTALPATPAPADLPRAYRRAGVLSAEARMELLIDRLVDYDAEVLHAASEREIPQAIAAALNGAGERRALAPAAFPGTWLPAGFEIIVDGSGDGGPGGPLAHHEIEGVPAVITTCEAAVAATGTIFLVHHGAQGRRVLTLLPDHHICVLRHGQVYELLPEALAAIAPQAGAPITTISGPSATSDIEMTRIRGVHGPRRLTVVLHGAA